jgi:hypothetical protein
MMNRNGEIGVVLDPVSVKDDFGFFGQINHPSKLSIFPNPGNSHFKIEFETKYPNEVFSYTIFNLTGRSVSSGKLNGFPYMVNDMSNFSSGEYILMLQSDRRTVSTRFLLVK